ncbi:MAG: type II toxin-antitoxin system prevent-host-death family antitoxin [Acidimicrobiia bacterium]|nr:type II toxin-antitoxin system prevent-host-death family antitoxin [Acidimicrobiia bacterium]
MAISKFKATCLATLERVRRTGRPLLVTKRGIPIAQILPPPAREVDGEMGFGSMQGRMVENGDLLEPLPPDLWDAIR